MSTVTIALLALAASITTGGAAPQEEPAGREQEPQERRKGDDQMVDCTMIFDLKGWSAIYRTAKGNGTITCDNGETQEVEIGVKGGGLTLGKSEVLSGTGRFTKARSIKELYGAYVQSEAHAGTGKSANAQALTKGKVSLALAGTGRGWDLGVNFGRFVIRPAGEKRGERGKDERRENLRDPRR
ncbi:MAG TPA: hypothetical protein VJV23_10380 [Candidatus Polarisedimenticolia bacterium]|nr:hypothetical protein [Candidatus Polarisedimenticolia bacterium]